MNFHYRTIQAEGQGIYKEKGSKFLGFAYPVDSEAEVKGRLDQLRKAYFDARHHCYAYVLGADRSKSRANDDGEPNHSAGDPILGKIRSKDLTNVLVVVVRYFGGIKLGVSGLIAAYRAAAEEALNNCQIIDVEVTSLVIIRYEYSATPEVMKLVKDFGIEVIDQSFGENGFFKGSFQMAKAELLTQKLELLKRLGVQLTWEL